MIIGPLIHAAFVAAILLSPMLLSPQARQRIQRLFDKLKL